MDTSKVQIPAEKQKAADQQIPTAKKELDLSYKSKKSYKALKVLNVVLAIFFGISLIVLTYLYFVRVNKVSESKEVVNLVVDNSVTDVEAETKNLENIKKDPKDRTALVEYSLLDSEDNFPFITTENFSKNNLEINKKGEIIKTDDSDSSRVVSIFFITQNSREEFEITNEELSKNIAEYLKEEDIRIFELDVSFTYLNDFEEILQLLKTELTDYEHTLTVYLYPKWGDFVDYSSYSTISNKFHEEVNLKLISELVDKIKVMAYDFTSPLDILPGPVTPKSWFEKILRYLISEEIPRSKLIFGINTSAYEWPEREFAYNPEQNYSVLAKEANSINRIDFQEFIESVQAEPENDLNVPENVYKYFKENESFVALMPSNEQIENLVQLCAEYGVYGVYYR